MRSEILEFKIPGFRPLPFTGYRNHGDNTGMVQRLLKTFNNYKISEIFKLNVKPLRIVKSVKLLSLNLKLLKMLQNYHIVTIGQNGRIGIPKGFRESLNLSEGERMFIFLEDREIRILPEREGALLIAGSQIAIKKRSGSGSLKTKLYREKGVGRSKETEEFNPESVYQMSEEGMSYREISEIYEKETGNSINQASLFRWVQKYKDEKGIK